jgi:hypothetical protein
MSSKVGNRKKVKQFSCSVFICLVFACRSVEFLLLPLLNDYWTLLNCLLRLQSFYFKGMPLQNKLFFLLLTSYNATESLKMVSADQQLFGQSFRCGNSRDLLKHCNCGSWVCNGTSLYAYLTFVQSYSQSNVFLLLTWISMAEP